MGRIAAGVCFEIVTVIALHHPVSAAGSSLQRPKKTRVFEKTFYENKPFSSLTAIFEKKKQILQKQAFFDINFNSNLNFK